MPLVEAADFVNHQQSVDRHHHPHTIASPSFAGDHALLGRDDDQLATVKHESSPREGDRVNRNLAATALTHDLIQTPHAALRRKSTYSQPVQAAEHNKNTPARKQNNQNNNNLESYHELVSSDASAISAAAPDLSVVAPSPRRLADWEVEDFVLLATIDGDLYAHDRKTGKERWHIVSDQPMIETIHHRVNTSVRDQDNDRTLLDQTIWAVEPADGRIYRWTPGQNQGLASTGLTMKRLVEELSPYKTPHKNKVLSITYNGEKKTTLVELDAATGRFTKVSSTNFYAAEQLTCERPHDSVSGWDTEECTTGTITLGRTEYTVRIESGNTVIATLKYTEWVPNLYDQDLVRQYSATLDDLYVTSRHDGHVFAYKQPSQGNAHNVRAQAFAQHLPSPIAKAFDVIRPAPEGEHPELRNLDLANPELVALPQPPPPSIDQTDDFKRDNAIFLNHTDGNWFALSGRAYPLMIQAPEADVTKAQWWENEESLDAAQITKHLVGQHRLDYALSKVESRNVLALPGSPHSAPELGDTLTKRNPTLAIDAPDPSSSIVIDIVKKLPQDAVHYAIDGIKNPVIIIILGVLLIVYRKEWIRRVKHQWHRLVQAFGFEVDLDDDTAEEVVQEQAADKEAVTSETTEVTARVAPPDSGVETPLVENQDEASPVPESNQPARADLAEQVPLKKKAHRGRRGGKNHRKKKGSPEPSVGDGPGNSVEEAVDIAKNIGERNRTLEPNIQTLPYEAEDVSNPILRIDESLEVNEDQQLGTGSNGTVVYAGKWQDRPVAVKRMLRDFYDIASQETRLLREVDRHQNVIQYFAQLERGQFIYIALELCEASLADVMEKPSQFRQLADAGAKDTLAVLKQITKGLDHLHSLQIGKCSPLHF